MMSQLTMAMVLALGSSGGQAAPGAGAVDGKAASTQPASRPAGEMIKAGQQIVAMGDSITQAGGYLRVIDAVFAQQYPDLKIPKVINVGISGEKAENMVKRFERDVVARRPDIVTISVGINDVWHRVDKPHDPEVLEEYARNVGHMVKMGQKAGARVILLSPTVIMEDPQSEGNRRLQMYIKAGQRVARQHNAEYVNLHEMFMRVIKQRGQTPKDENGKAAGQLTTDGVHMTPMGNTLMAVGVLRALGVSDGKIRATDLSEVFEKK